MCHGLATNPCPLIGRRFTDITCRSPPAPAPQQIEFFALMRLPWPSPAFPAAFQNTQAGLSRLVQVCLSTAQFRTPREALNTQVRSSPPPPLRILPSHPTTSAQRACALLRPRFLFFWPIEASLRPASAVPRLTPRSVHPACLHHRKNLGYDIESDRKDG